MSFWNAVKTNIAHVKQQIADVQSFPTEITCPATSCLHVTSIPVTAFDWTCINKHPCAYTQDVCWLCDSTLKDVKQRNLYHPRINCQKCNRLLDLPTTKIQSMFETARTTAPIKAECLLHDVKKGVQDLNKQPDVINCEHCNAEITLPSLSKQNNNNNNNTIVDNTKPSIKDQWICKKCFKANHNTKLYCCNQKCNRYRYQDGINCPKCRQLTQIPSKNIFVKLQSLGHNIQTAGTKGMGDVLNRPYSLCTTCNVAILLNKEEIAFLLKYQKVKKEKQEQQQQQQYPDTTATNTTNPYQQHQQNTQYPTAASPSQYNTTTDVYQHRLSQSQITEQNSTTQSEQPDIYASAPEYDPDLYPQYDLLPPSQYHRNSTSSNNNGNNNNNMQLQRHHSTTSLQYSNSNLSTTPSLYQSASSEMQPTTTNNNNNITNNNNNNINITSESQQDKHLDVAPPSYDDVVVIPNHNQKDNTKIENNTDAATAPIEKDVQKIKKPKTICHSPGCGRFNVATLEKACNNCKAINFITESSLARKIKSKEKKQTSTTNNTTPTTTESTDINQPHPDVQQHNNATITTNINAHHHQQQQQHALQTNTNANRQLSHNEINNPYQQAQYAPPSYD